MQQMTLFSHDDPLVTFELQAGAPILLRHIYHENAHLLPFSLRGKELQEVLPDWLSNRFSENGLWLIHALKKHNTSIDMLSALQITSALSLTDAFWIHDGSKTWSSKQPRPEGRSFIVASSKEALHSDGLQRPLTARQCDQDLQCFDLH